jgi:hypothetical protein
MIGLLIFTAIMLGACVFLIYFLVALWRDSHKHPRLPRVEIRKLPRGNNGKLLRIYSPENLGALDRTGSGRL